MSVADQLAAAMSSPDDLEALFTDPEYHPVPPGGGGGGGGGGGRGGLSHTPLSLPWSCNNQVHCDEVT